MKISRRASEGFTLVELMVASAVSVAVVLSLVSAFVQQRGAYRAMQQVNEMNQNVRTAMDTISRDLRMAGYGCTFPRSATASWITWVSGITNYVTVAQGAGTASDTLNIVGAFDSAVATLASATSTSGATVLTLQSGQTTNFSTSKKKVIFIGRSETARITAISGNTLTISTSPTNSGAALLYTYPAGTPVELVKVVTYRYSNLPYEYPQEPILQRDENNTDYEYQWQTEIAGNIEDFQAMPTTNGALVAITGRTDKLDPKYTSSKTDHYRRKTLTAEFKTRRPDVSRY